MDLLILRHGEATQTAPDFGRVLTSDGREAVARTCRELSMRGMHPDVVAASPLVRARETAAIAIEETGVNVAVESWPELESGADPVKACLRLSGVDGMVLVVTHQPFASRLVEHLTGEDTPMKTAMVACVGGDVLEPGRCELRWTLRG